MSVETRMKRLLESLGYIGGAGSWGNYPPAEKKKGRGVECVKCGKKMHNDREYEETDEGPMCSSCGTKAGRWY